MIGRTLDEMQIIKFLEDLVHKRFSLENLKKYLKENYKDFIVELVERDLEYIDGFVDYNLIGSLQNKEKDILCDFDIYYAKTRSGEMYITEVGYEFQ